MNTKPKNTLVAMAVGAIVILILAQVIIPAPAWGMTIRHDYDDDSLYRDLADETQYLVSGKAISGSSLGSGTLITPEWVLTAGHVVTPSVSINFTVNGVTIAADTSSYAFHPDTDLALFRLVSPVDGLDYPPLFKPDMGSERGRTATVVGSGKTGTGLTGDVEPAGTKRGGQNKIDWLGPDWNWPHYEMMTDFDTPSGGALDLEFGSAHGDSGGGLFFDVGGETYIAGVQTTMWYNDGTPNADYGDGGSFIRTSQTYQWIEDTVGPPPVEVTLGLIDNGCPGTGLHSYTLTATGPGITTLSKFTIDAEVHQVFDEGNPSEWLGDGSALESETTDSHVIFGDLRLPDLGGETWPGPGEQPNQFTEETITGSGDSGLGTLNNYNSAIPAWDAYLKLGTPSAEEETVELIQLVVEDGNGFSIDLTLLTSTSYDPATGEWIVTAHDDLTFSLAALTAGDANGDGAVDSIDAAILAQHWLQQSGATWADGDFNRDGAVDSIDATILAANWQSQSANVPEPSVLLLAAFGGFMVLGVAICRR